MSDLLKKFGMFDIMGVWAPGSISLLYILITIAQLHNIDIFLVLKESQCDFSIVFIFLFSISAYFLGVVFHEIGKGITDFKPPFTFRTLLNLQNKEHLNVLEKRFVGLTKMKNCVFEETDMNIYEVLEEVKKNKINVSSIEKARSIYGFSRSVMISFVLHAIILLIYLLNSYVVNSTFWIIDVIFIILFLLRTIRYYYIWIQKTLNSFDNVCKPQGEKK